MAVIINGDTGIDKITDGSVVADDLASTLDLSSKTITLATDAAVVSKLSTATGSAPSYSARAWVNFNGTGTVAIRESGNVSSITDNGRGNYTVNFTTAMPDANYAVNGTINSFQTNNASVTCAVSGSSSGTVITLKTTTQVRVVTAAVAGNYDMADVNVLVFR